MVNMRTVQSNYLYVWSGLVLVITIHCCCLWRGLVC